MPYTTPWASDLKTRYPAFDAVADATIEAAITDAGRRVDTSWLEDDYQPAIMALAAHIMTTEGLGSSISAQLAGLKSLRVGPLSLERELSGSLNAGSLGSTVYGQRFLELLRLNHPGVAVAEARFE